MGNGKKLNGRGQRRSPDPKPALRVAADASDRIAEAEGPQDFVVVLAYKSPDGEIEEDFGQLVENIKALYTFKNDVRVYAVIEERAKDILGLLETPKDNG